MRVKGLLLLLALAVGVAGVNAAEIPRTSRISGDYMEFRTADIYTGPCFANAEVGLTGYEAILAWRVREGSWGGVALDGLSVVAVVRASATLGDPFANALPAKAVLIVDSRASAEQRKALVNFVQAQTEGLLNDIVAVEALVIRFTVDEGGRHGAAILEAGNLAKLSTRAVSHDDSICRNEDVYYQPLAANLSHAMPAVATASSYRGNHLGTTWSEAGRRGSFVGTFAL